MADFVAVIRRAVDGLTENTPEMRAKVYDKAKGAVVRQLENMKPRPPEVMFKRQLDKLDDAIRQVEQENSEALPADQDETSAAEPVAAQPSEIHAEEPAPAPQTHVEAESVHHEEPVSTVADEPVRHEAPAHEDEPAYRDEAPDTEVSAAHEEASAAETYPRHEEAAHVEPAQEEQAVEHQPAAAQEPVADHDDPLLAHAEPVRHHASNRVMEHPFAEQESEFPGDEPDHAAGGDQPGAVEHHAVDAHESAHYEEPRAGEPAQTQSAMPDWGVDIDREPETVVAEQADDEHPQPQMPRAALSETDVASGFNAFLKQEFSTPAVPPPPSKKGQDGEFSWDAPFDDLPDLPKPVAFEAALEAKQREIETSPERAAHEARQKDARSELEDLIGYTGDSDAGRSGDGDKLPPEVSRAMSKLEGKSFKIHKKKSSFNPLPIVLGVAAALVVAGGAYGLYHYRDDVSTLVASYMPSDTAEKPADTKTEAAATDAAKGVQDAAKTADDSKPTEVASLDPNIAPTKFTQRLLSDGTETETDAAKIPVDQTLKEGKTIAGQTEAGDQVASTDATVPAANADQANADTNSLAVAQKMFLYEEQLGGSPVAVPGKVTWSVKNDTAGAGDKKQSMIEASIDVPDRKLKALITFKRNTDVSLPASHIVEIVFDLPDDFAEGNVESVQRIAFKQTEQDRGNGLIAVPAKITDDFHMVALNDDADARKVNGELMKSRSWIDIPITYRNNRRALITLEKGATGTEAFDKVLAEWNALGAQVNND